MQPVLGSLSRHSDIIQIWSLGTPNPIDQSLSRTTRRHRAGLLGAVPATPTGATMTHTTALGIGSAWSRHRAVIGRGAECQERESGHCLGIPPRDTPTPGENVSSLAHLGVSLAGVILRGSRAHHAVQICPTVRA
ncbi:hypothetical protein PEBR_06264 [Penicillium brasilianum]|uniref:Uncharacterized protein n=1 Tax=Penicillium brasilianum TaxID=104259 RepID=A0A1S9RY16_PENBI|nr:hypothetical protein PEBR_06264 [Penicillium brasilianum]